jgi:hypothetical protein
MAILGSTESLYYPVTIKPDPSGFDQWIADGGIPLHPSDDDLLTYEEFEREWNQQGCDIYELPDDELPDNLPNGVEDVTGKILSEPDRVFAVVCPWGIQYVGLEIFTEDMLEDDEAVPNPPNTP